MHKIPQKEIKEDLKPFKRQSYHVAIAYHIHLKHLKNGNSEPNLLDPTYNARMLREKQQAQREQPRQDETTKPER